MRSQNPEASSQRPIASSQKPEASSQRPIASSHVFHVFSKKYRFLKCKSEKNLILA